MRENGPVNRLAQTNLQPVLITHSIASHGDDHASMTNM